MAAAEKIPNVVKVCNRPNLYDELEDIQDRLSVCEKALAEYLETKRLAFPRFYFISSADLLDILSNGNQPVKVDRGCGRRSAIHRASVCAFCFGLPTGCTPSCQVV